MTIKIELRMNSVSFLDARKCTDSSIRIKMNGSTSIDPSCAGRLLPTAYEMGVLSLNFIYYSFKHQEIIIILHALLEHTDKDLQSSLKSSKE